MARAGAAILEAALPHVAFDGWSEATFRAAITESGQPEALARALYPRGGLDLALAFHRAGDARMAERMEAADLTGMRYSEKVAFAIRTRLEVIDDPETVRRGMTLFALPHHAGEGARALWGTADAIWHALGDTSRDLNWYSKRAALSAVYGATVLYWLGDGSAGQAATAEFIDRRIADVMRIEKFKAGLRDNPLARIMRNRPGAREADPVAPHPAEKDPAEALPGRWR
ncbi:COQ9 family protein [Tabrizicola sp. DMG-N-6]|uniref:COQ9 family protein n=2 Tax=Szabonella alba TaxID=2804194 RepID=A0A8K0VB68_9RHOB|nr:COQ9 family protein [Szabonella alba]